MYVLHVYFITFAGQFLFTRWNYIVNTGPENICYFNDRTFSIYFPGSEVHGIWTPTYLKSLWNILVNEVYLQSNKNCKELINGTEIRWRHPHHMHIGHPSLQQQIQQGISNGTGHPSLLIFLLILYVPSFSKYNLVEYFSPIRPILSSSHWV